jgi:dihydrofolate reductase
LSADGFIARCDGSVDWLDDSRRHGNYEMDGFYQSVDTILWGRKTYEMALGFQEKGVPGSAFDTRVKNYIFTRSQPQSAPPAGVCVRTSQSFREPPARAGRKRDLDDGRRRALLLHFSTKRRSTKFIMTVIPAFIGEGIPLIAPKRRTAPLELISCERFTDGAVNLRYAVHEQP